MLERKRKNGRSDDWKKGHCHFDECNEEKSFLREIKDISVVSLKTDYFDMTE